MDGLRRELASLEATLAEGDAPKGAVIEELSAMRNGLARASERRSSLALDNVRVAAPCKERWADMVGDERVRVCAGCERPVFNLSEMTREEAESVLATRGIKPCVRFYRRADGTVMTADCAPGARRSRRLAVVAAGTAMFGSTAAMAEPPAPPVAGDATTDATTEEKPAEIQVTMGDPVQTEEPIEPLMGEMIPWELPEQPTFQWSTWVRAGYGLESKTPNVATRSIMQPPPFRGPTWEEALGADITLAVAWKGKVRVGAWGEIRTSSEPVIGGELLVHGLPPGPHRYGFAGGGGLVLRAGGNGHAFTGAIGLGYVGSWSRSPHHLVGVRFVASMTRSTDDARDWTTTFGVELEPIGALTYLVHRFQD